MKRKLKDSDVYLFFNEGAMATSDSITFHHTGQLVEEWDPATGEVSAMVSTRDEEGETMSVKLKLKPYEMWVLIMR